MAWRPTTVPGKPPKECVGCAAKPEGERPKVWRPTDRVPRSPRCASCQRARRAEAKESSRNGHRSRRFALSPENHGALLVYQGGRCWICQRAKAVSKSGRSLAVDHDHACCAEPPTCGRCTRGLLCHGCNELIGRYGPHALARAIAYQNGDTPMARLRREMPAS